MKQTLHEVLKFATEVVSLAVGVITLLEFLKKDKDDNSNDED